MSIDELMNIKIEVASHFKESRLEAGSTVEVITPDDWRALGARRTEDAISHLPSTMIFPTIGGSHAISIRGYASAVSVRGIATLLDNIPVNGMSSGTAQYHLPNIELDTLSRIEMLRGPGSAIYGSDAFHGVYSLKTFDSDENMFDFSSEAATNRFYQSGIKFSQSLSDKIRITSALSSSGQPDQHEEYEYTNPYTGTLEEGERKNRYQSISGHTKLKWKNESGDTVSLAVYGDSWDAKQFPGITRNYLGSSYQLGQDWMDATASFYMGKGMLIKKLDSEIELQLTGFYWEMENDLTMDYTLTPGGGIFGNYIKQSPSDIRTGAEIMLKQPPKILNTQWLVSYSYNFLKVDSSSITTISPEGETLNTIHTLLKGMKREIHSFYFQMRTGIFEDTFHLLYGSRIDDYSDFGLQFTPRLGVVYFPDKEYAVKLLYGRAFRALTALEWGPGGSNNLKPETIDTYELVFMKQGGRINSDFTLFYSKWNDAIMIDNRAYTNNGENESQGAEAALHYLSRSLKIDLSGSFVQSKNITEKYDYEAFPQYIFNLGFGYMYPKYQIESYLSNRINYGAESSPQTTAVPDPEKLDTYFRTDFHISKSFSDHFSTWLNIQNLFNRKNYFPSIWNVEGGIPDTPLSVSIGAKLYL